MTLSKFTGLFFITVSCFPWVGISGFDTQPFSIILAIFYLLADFLINPVRFAVPRFILVLSVSLFFGLFSALFLTNSLDFIFIRGVAMYLGISIYLVAFSLFIKNYGFPISVIYYCNVLWLVAALIQIFSPDLFFVVVSNRTTEYRGLTSLAPEPTFFGIYLFFSSWILAASSGYRPLKRIKFLIFLNIAAIIFLAMSSMVVLFLILASLTFFDYSPSHFSKRYLFVIISILFIFFSVLNQYFESSRLNSLIILILDNPALLFVNDASANARLSSIVLPTHAFFIDFFLPHGFYGYPDSSEKIAPFYGDFFFYEYNKFKIESWLGSIIFELGIFGLFAVFIIFKELCKFGRKSVFEAFLLFILLLSAIPTAFPIVYLLISLLIIVGKVNIYSASPLSRPIISVT